jgi:hypothetical protein
VKPNYLLQIVLACHSLVTVATIALICYLVYGGLAGLPLRSHPLLFFALIWPFLIGVQLILNRGDCVFQTCAKALNGRTGGWARDLYFVPESWARHIPIIFTPLYLVGVALVLWHAYFRP